MVNGLETLTGCEIEDGGIKIFADTVEGNKKAKELFDSKPFSYLSGGWRPIRMEVHE